MKIHNADEHYCYVMIGWTPAYSKDFMYNSLNLNNIL